MSDVFHIELSPPPEQGRRLLTRPASIARAVRSALLATGFDEHGMWPQDGTLSVVVEGDGRPDDVADMALAFLGGEDWSWRARAVDGEDLPATLRGEQRSRAIVGMAVERDDPRCDLCEAVAPPPHNTPCTYAQADDTPIEMHGGGDGGWLSGGDPVEVPTVPEEDTTVASALADV